MNTKLLRKLLFLVMLGITWAVILHNPQSANAYMACCSSLNCDGKYANCVNSCATLHPGDASCMDTCLTHADACANTLCDDCSGESYACWFDWVDGCGQADTPYSICSGDGGCAYPDVCHDGTCVRAGCTGAAGECYGTDLCDTAHGLCLQSCSTNFDCPSGQSCTSGMCQ